MQDSGRQNHLGEQDVAGVEEHIPCHKGAYMGRNGITRDRLERPAGTQGIKEGGG